MGRNIGSGLLSKVLCHAVFYRIGFMMKYFTKRAVFEVLPTAAVLSFSFNKGAFVRKLKDVLRILARKSTDAGQKLKETEHNKIHRRKRQSIYAHINPFHNIMMKQVWIKKFQLFQNRNRHL